MQFLQMTFDFLKMMEWLRMIRDHIVNSFYMEREDLELSPFNANGGLGKMWQLFGEELDLLIQEMNEALVA
ncbi:MAG: hypothetical protein M0Z60_10970 [Nitrospiraceae bacterium]|nr:hypothetical protein [Nitrospiraceae bacterium]